MAEPLAKQGDRLSGRLTTGSVPIVRGKSVDDLLRANAPSFLGQAAFNSTFHGSLSHTIAPGFHSAHNPPKNAQPIHVRNMVSRPIGSEPASVAPADASNFDVLFGRTVTSDHEYKSRGMVSAFDVYFGGNATVVDTSSPGAPRIPSPSRPIDVETPANAQTPANPRSDMNPEGSGSMTRPRPAGVVDLVIPVKTTEDPSDHPMQVDRGSPTELLREEGTGLDQM